jgi:hypothetical protein
MQAFIIEAPNRPGELARVAEVIAGRGINIEAFSLGFGSGGAIAFLTNDEKGLQSALDDDGVTYTEVPFLTVSLEDKPGTIAKTARRLADVGVNIEFLAPVDFAAGRKATVAIGVDKIEVARTALSDQLTDWKVPEAAFAESTTR